MADHLTPAQRSRNMSLIGSKNTKPEMLVRRFLFGRGFRYRLHSKKLPGKPDIILKKYNTVVFVHGCFWHGHENCRCYRLPKSRVEWWQAKIDRNRTRDSSSQKMLAEAGWSVIIVWECSLKNVSERNSFLFSIERDILNNADTTCNPGIHSKAA
jgi:DNA mismatch endonuclease, patch repair protein